MAQDFDPEARFPPGALPATGSENGLETRILSIVPGENRSFAQRYRSELLQAEGLTVMLNANATHVQLDAESRRITSVEVRTLNGRSFTVEAGLVVLACHAIENARLLLASNDVLPGGIGNRSGFVGRCFMDHAVLHSGLVMTEAR